MKIFMTLAIMNYETAIIKIIALSEDVVNKYGNDFDKYVYGVLGYKQSSVSYMVSEEITIIKN
jgi:hypothetical protein